MLDPHVNQMYMVTEINLSDSHHLQASNGSLKNMYESFRDKMKDSWKSESKYIIFDDKRLTAYIVWGTFDVKKAS